MAKLHQVVAPDFLFEMKSRKKIVFVAMSGGVDSSVAALLLKRRGYQVVGIFIHSYNLDGCEEKDARDARLAAAKIKIPFYTWNLEKEYREKVVEYMVRGYRQGITPNPDIVCNQEIKFGLFFKKAIEAGADFVATGHYVQKRDSKIRTRLNPSASHRFVDSDKFVASDRFVVSHRFVDSDAFVVLNRYRLFQAKDKNKDQSYFLWTLKQEQLKHCLFPIGRYLKPEVRQIAEKAGLPNARKKDSQGICFLGKIKMIDFLKQRIPEKRGAVLTVEGEEIGEHRGVWFYTIGQRHIGILNFCGRRSDSSEPHYVVEKDVKKNILIVAQGENHPALYKNEINLTQVNFINPQLITNNKEQHVCARVRYRQTLAKAKLTCYQSSTINCRLIFEKPVKFIAPGQSAVFYGKNQELLGGGIISI